MVLWPTCTSWSTSSSSVGFPLLLLLLELSLLGPPPFRLRSCRLLRLQLFLHFLLLRYQLRPEVRVITQVYNTPTKSLHSPTITKQQMDFVNSIFKKSRLVLCARTIIRHPYRHISASSNKSHRSKIKLLTSGEVLSSCDRLASQVASWG